MSKVVVEYSNRLQQAVDSALSTTALSVAQNNRTRGRSALNDISDSASGYSGYFKVIDASETKEDGTKTLKIKIVDGADPAASSCGIATVNNVEVVILSKTVELVKNASVQYVYCRCKIKSPSRIGGGIEISNTRPARQSGSSVTMVIARVFSENNSMRIVQDHYGEIWMPYMLECPGRES